MAVVSFSVRPVEGQRLNNYNAFCDNVVADGNSATDVWPANQRADDADRYALSGLENGFEKT